MVSPLDHPVFDPTGTWESRLVNVARDDVVIEDEYFWLLLSLLIASIVVPITPTVAAHRFSLLGVWATTSSGVVGATWDRTASSLSKNPARVARETAI